MSCIKCKRKRIFGLLYCGYCLTYILPNFHKKSFKKEYAMRDLIGDYLFNHHHLLCEYNKSLKGLSYKPDIYFEKDGFPIIIEIDEFAHKAYRSDRDRDIDILSNIQNITIIRINVDSYKKHNEKYPPISIREVSYLDEELNPVYNTIINYDELNRRLNIIRSVLNSAIQHTFSNTVVSLFYDD